MPRPWQTSVTTGWFYGLGILTFAYLTAIWMKKWFAYWRVYHRIHGDTTSSAIRAEVDAWWMRHGWFSRVAILAVFITTVMTYLIAHWPNAAAANIWLVGGLAVATISSRLTAHERP